MTTEEIENKLVSFADSEYKKFTEKLVPNCNSILGVRLPTLRSMAREIARSDYESFIHLDHLKYYEEVMLQGLVIGYANISIDQHIIYIKQFIPRINNWAVCDSFCNTLKKTTLKNEEKIWKLISSYASSKECYEIRFAAVMMLHFVNANYIDKIFRLSTQMEQTEYYAYMAIAWLISICYVSFPNETTTFLKLNLLPKETHNKAIQKIRESRQVDRNKKEEINQLKRDQ